MTVVIHRNGREGDLFGFIVGFCTDGNLGETAFPGDPNFDQVTFPQTEPGASQPCVKFQTIVAAQRCFISINGLTAGDSLCLPNSTGGTTCTPMEQVGGVSVQFGSATPGIDVIVGVAMDTTLCNGNGYWTRGPNNSQISMPGRVLIYHELVGHGLHQCDGTFNAADPEGQAIGEENVLRGLLGLETRTSHEGGCGGGTNCFIAGAAYGSQAAPQVQALRDIRDRVIRSTSWGEAVFDEIYRQYYAISPPIAARIAQDERLRTAVRVALVEPWSIALRLLLALPADTSDPAAAVTFAATAADEFGAWARGLPLTEAVPPGELAIEELLFFLRAFPNPQLRSGLLEALRRGGFLPLPAPSGLLSSAVEEFGLPPTDAALLLGPRGDA